MLPIVTPREILPDVVKPSKGVKLLLPSDVVLADKFDNDANTAVANVTEISGDWRGLDIGPETLEEFRKEITEKIIYGKPRA